METPRWLKDRCALGDHNTLPMPLPMPLPVWFECPSNALRMFSPCLSNVLAVPLHCLSNAPSHARWSSAFRAKGVHALA